MYYYQYSYILSNFAHLWASVDHNQKYWCPVSSMVSGIILDCASGKFIIVFCSSLITIGGFKLVISPKKELE